MTTELDAFLAGVEAHAPDLPEAPDGDTLTEMSRRVVHVGGRTCVRCGTHAGWAAVANTGHGARWVDLCWGCAGWMTTEYTARINREIGELNHEHSRLT